MLRFNVFQWLSILLMFTALNAQAQEKPVSQLRAFLTSSKALKADFKQIAIDEAGNARQTSYGVFIYADPESFVGSTPSLLRRKSFPMQARSGFTMPTWSK
jgi:outer membrane lipoprotein carrier protein